VFVALVEHDVDHLARRHARGQVDLDPAATVRQQGRAAVGQIAGADFGHVRATQPDFGPGPRDPKQLREERHDFGFDVQMLDHLLADHGVETAIHPRQRRRQIDVEFGTRHIDVQPAGDAAAAAAQVQPRMVRGGLDFPAGTQPRDQPQAVEFQPGPRPA
jgi:hypothetical protein